MKMKEGKELSKQECKVQDDLGCDCAVGTVGE